MLYLHREASAHSVQFLLMDQLNRKFALDLIIDSNILFEVLHLNYLRSF
jgi:hypothetical protein